MKLFLILTGITFFCYFFKKEPVKYDICVYGGTSGGLMAAYTAVKYGLSVILIEPGNHLGGLSSGGLGYTDIGNKFAITGLALDFYRRLGKHYGKFEQWIFEPHVAESLFNDYVRRAKIKVLFNYRIIKAEKNAGFIRQIMLQNSTNPSPSLNKSIAAKMFIDCSYEGDLMAKAGISYTIGREANSTYNETYNGVQLMEGHQFPDGIDPYRVPGDSSSGLLWGISNEQLQQTGSGDKRVQTYNYRICLTDDAKNSVPITHPPGYDSAKYELLLRLINAQPGKRTLNDYFFFGKMPGHKTDINNRGGFSTDMIGMNYEYADADYDKRKQIIHSHEIYTKGLLYFFGHDPRVPEPLRKEMLEWGYPKDEFKDNHNWSPQLYIRESRRMIGSYIMTQANCEGKEVVSDTAGLAAYTMDSHNCERIVINGMVKNEGNVEIGGFGPYPISYRALIPKASECKNLIVPVCLSASHIAYGSIRMEPVFMELAQTAALAACLAVDNHVPVQDVNIRLIRKKLKEDPLMDGSVPEILVDNEDNSNVIIKGDWKKEKSGGYGPSWLLTGSENKEASVQFNPAISSSGYYDIYSYFPKSEKPSLQTEIIIFDGKQSKLIKIDNSSINVEGQTSGEWISLGNYQLQNNSKPYVLITTKNANGEVAADAILLVKK